MNSAIGSTNNSSNLSIIDKYADGLSDLKEYSASIIDIKNNDEIYFDLIEYQIKTNNNITSFCFPK